MIRARRDEDFDPLCNILKVLEYPSGSLSDGALEAWLDEDDAEQSWVFDQAPVSVAPTRNVVGHVQIFSPAEGSSAPHLVEYSGRPAGDLLAVGKLFVKPNPHEYGIGRYLLKESVNYITGQRKTPVLDIRVNGFLTKAFCERYGFAEIPSDDPDVAPMIYTT